MIRLGVIGTNWISKAFVEAALSTKQYEFMGVYSRKAETGHGFCQNFGGGAVYTDFVDFCNCPDFEMVYIASPNALHFEQAKALLMVGTSVIVEKPAFSNRYEFAEIKRIASEHEVMVFEAARHIHEANFARLKAALPKIGQPIGGYLNYIQYSSRYEAVLAGETPNIFSLEYSGGALMDLGVYPIYGAVSLFGLPRSARYFVRTVATGVDGIGTIILGYEDFDLTLMISKTARSQNQVEIYGSKGTLRANSIANIDSIRVESGQGLTENLAAPLAVHGMEEEARVFAAIFLNQDMAAYEGLLKLAEEVAELMTALRQDAGIVFLADNFL